MRSTRRAVEDLRKSFESLLTTSITRRNGAIFETNRLVAKDILWAAQSIRMTQGVAANEPLDRLLDAESCVMATIDRKSMP